jgi:hypothetical protein
MEFSPEPRKESKLLLLLSSGWRRLLLLLHTRDGAEARKLSWDSSRV